MNLRCATAVWLIAAAFFPFPIAAQESPLALGVIQEQYQAQLELTRRPLTNLGAQYREALINLRDDLQKKADLDGLVIVKNELERFDQQHTPATEDSSLSSVARLQKIYRAGHNRKRGELGDKLSAVHSAYRKRLEALKTKLTAAGDIESALEVQAELKKLGAATLGEIDLERGLVLHFRFNEDSDETVRDSSDTRNDGRLMGDAKILSTGGNRGRHVVFDGRGDYIEIPHHETLALTTNGTISIWVRIKRFGGMRGFVSKYAPNNSWTFRNWKDARLKKASFGDYDHTFHSTRELKLDHWTHLVVTLKDGKVTFYFDGELDSEGQRPAPLVSNTNPVRIGSCYDGRYFNGAIDDVRIYNRALSTEEVARLFEIES